MMPMPNVYPCGTPLRWQDDSTGVLPRAVRVFMEAGPDTDLDPEVVEAVRDYCSHYIEAPCWTSEGMSDRFAELRERIKTATTVETIDIWLQDCLRVGLDPL